MYQNQYDRERSRDRSRDREKKYYKSPSEDSNEYRRHRHVTREQKENKHIKPKRVKYCVSKIDLKMHWT